MAYSSNKSARGVSVNAFSSCISTTLMLVLLGTVMFFVSFASHFSKNLRENFTITIILDDEMTQTETLQFQNELCQLAAARQVSYISKEKALEEQIAALDSDPSEFMGTNPMPASFEVHLKAEYAQSDSLSKILPQLEKHKKVVDVSYPQSLLESLNRNIHHISTILLVIALLLTFVSFVLINNTIQMSVYSHRFLIRTMKLVGATWSFIRKPFLIKALTIGLISATLASGVLALGIYSLMEYEPEVQKMITWETLLNAFGVVFICGIGLTVFCAFVTVNRTLKMKDGKLYRY